MKREILDSVPPEKIVSLEQEIIPNYIERQECAGFETHERVYDIGTPERLKHFETYLKETELRHKGTITESKTILSMSSF